MNVKRINMGLHIGRMSLSPAPSALTEAFQTATVSYSDSQPCACSVQFNADRPPGFSKDYSILTRQWLKPTHRLALTLTLNGRQHVLMDGIITNLELSHTQASGSATLTATVEDISVMMDLFEYSREYPGMPDFAIATEVLARYAISIGVIPEAIPAMHQPLSNPLIRIPQQNATDKCFLMQLASRNGYIFRIRPGPKLGENTAYWGPLIRVGIPQRALTLDMGSATNVHSINFNYDATRPTLMHGYAEIDEVDEPMPVATLKALNIPPLARDSGLASNLPFVRNHALTDPRLTYARALYEAQLMTNNSTRDIVTASGQLDGLRYGDVLKSPGMVGVRGAGDSFDGLYYVNNVTHTLSRSGYQQQFQLAREGTGSTVPEVTP